MSGARDLPVACSREPRSTPVTTPQRAVTGVLCLRSRVRTPPQRAVMSGESPAARAGASASPQTASQWPNIW